MAGSSTLPEVLDSANTVAGDVARGVGDQEHVEGEGELRLVGGSAGLVPHLHLQREREVQLITLGNLRHGILRTFVIV